MWYDADNNIHKLFTIKNKKYKNKVYRCYPIENNKYAPIEIRYDKKKPNSYFIIDQIQNINKFDWLSNKFLNNIKYYENPKIINDNYLIKLLNNQINNLKNIIETIKPQINKNWLDLGCGKCKLFRIIKDTYYPHKYIGIDNDTSLLSKVYKTFQSY
jgi:cyclopropane fatty-acyl-phospholipid synthase-like methyltransferase